MHLNLDSRPAQGLAMLALGTLAAGGIVMNATFGWSQGHSPLDQYVLGGVSIAADVLKVMFLGVAANQIRKGHSGKGWACRVLWAMCVLYGIYSATGFVLKQYQHRIDAHAAVMRTYNDAKAEIARAEAAVEDAKKGLNDKGKSIWQSSGACFNATTPESNAFCNNYYVALGALKKAKEALPIEPAMVADPQVRLLAEKTGWTISDVTLAISLGLAVFFETISSFAGYAVSKSIAKPGFGDAKARERRQRRRRRGKVQATGNVVAFGKN